MIRIRGGKDYFPKPSSPRILLQSVTFGGRLQNGSLPFFACAASHSSQSV